MTNVTLIDCNKIDLKFIVAYVKNYLSKQDISSNEEAIEKLILYCNNDMARINNELDKISAYLTESKNLTTAVVEEFVVQDKEFQVFQLAEFLAKGDAFNAIELVDSFSFKSGSAFSIMTPLFNNYRRALFVSLNKDKTNSELATLLGVKEYAIKLLQNQVKIYSPKKLKSIVSMITQYDRKIKLGEMKENVAIKTLIFNILNRRGQND